MTASRIPVAAVVSVLIICAAIGSIGCRDLSVAGDPKEASAQREGGMQDSEIEDFASFPLFWLGAEFDGLELTFVDEVNRPALLAAPAEHSVTFVYGTCDPTPEYSCPAPLQITIYGECGPQLAPRVAKAEPSIRGATAQRAAPGHLYLESLGSKILVIATAGEDPDAKAKAVAQRLIGANTMARSVDERADFDAIDSANFAPTTCQ